MHGNMKNLLNQAAQTAEAYGALINKIKAASEAKEKRIGEGLLALLDLVADNDNSAPDHDPPSPNPSPDMPSSGGENIAADPVRPADNDNSTAASSGTMLVPAAEIAPSGSQGGATLYRGDCLEVMRSMPSGSVDLIFTSPPYNIGMTHGGRRQTLKKSKVWRSADFEQGYASYDDARSPEEYAEWQKEVLRECWRLLSPKGAIFYQHKPRIQNKLLTTPLDYNPGLPLRQIVIWNRKGGNNFNKAFFVPAHEWVTIFAKPDFHLAPGGWNATDVWTINPERGNPHPAPFPAELPGIAIAATDAQTIFDPFMGSGSTGVAAMRNGRKFIGIELDGSYLENARQRLENEKALLDQGQVSVKPARAAKRTNAKHKPSANDNDNAIPYPKAPMNSGKGNSRRSLPDEVFMDCLSNQWISAWEIFKLLTARGLKVSEGTVYNRMRKLAAARPLEIDVHPSPERWRLRNGSDDTEPSTPNGSPNATSQPATARATMTPGLQVLPPPSSSVPTHGNDQASLHHGDCLEVMKALPDDSVDLILADLPYGTTGLGIDRRLPLDELWAEYRRVLKKPHGNIVLFGSQPFTSMLVNSAPDIFRHSLVWEKNKATGFQHASAKPLKRHEDILVFSYGVNISEKRTGKRATYNPQGAIKVTKKAQGLSDVSFLAKAIRGHEKGTEFEGLTNCPDSIIRFPKDKRSKGETVHPFAKPVALLEYLILTYSNEGEVVLDNTMGSGSAGVAALNTGRRFIGIEKDDEWFEVARERIETARRADEQPIVPIPCAPKVRTDDTTIYQGDCLEVMRSMPSGSVDLIVTSPPYNLGLSARAKPRSSKDSSWSNAKLFEGYGDYDDNMSHDDYLAWQQDVLRQCWRLISEKGAIFYNHKPRIQKGELWLPHELNPGLPLRQEIIWDRGSGMNHGATFCTPSHERILLFAKPQFRFLKGKPRDVWRINPARNNDHPAPFPLELPLTAIRHTAAETVLDPFSGSGTTGVAARMLGRKFIGIERNGEYIDHAWKRIEAESALARAA